MVTFARLHHSRYDQELRTDLGRRDFIVRKDEHPKGASPEQKAKTQRKKRR